MGYNTANTVWPTVPVDQGVRDIIDLFFSLVDQDSPNVGRRLTDEVFTPIGVLITASRKFEGTSGMYLRYLRTTALL